MNIADSLAILSYVFRGENRLPCLDAADADGEGPGPDVGDALFTLRYLLLGGSPFPEPYPRCGQTGGEGIGCDRYRPCESGCGLRGKGCPRISAFGIGIRCNLTNLIVGAVIDFDPTFLDPVVWLLGEDFDEVAEVLIEDEDGRRFLIGPQVFRRPELSGPNRPEALRFSIANARLGFPHPRGNLKVCVLQEGGTRSNEVYVPTLDFRATELGPVVNGVIVPRGIQRDRVLFIYSIYSAGLSEPCTYPIRLEWKREGQDTWNAARPADVRGNDGAGDVLPEPLRLTPTIGPFCARGALRSFLWDARNDAALDELDDGFHRLVFRIRSGPSACVEEIDPGTLFVTPPILYHKTERD